MQMPDPASRPAKQNDAIPESNIGYKMLKAAGWKENKGLGVEEQGRLRPIETLVRQGREGIGTRVAHEDGGNKKPKRKIVNKEDEVSQQAGAKPLSKNARKRLREAQLAKDEAIARELYREFMPDNV